jgi:pimeloyl-ACP methyl ester carboxylesterase
MTAPIPRLFTAVGWLLFATLVGSLLFTTAVAMRGFSEEEAYRYHYYIRATYCDAEPVELWSCGSACSSVPGFQTFKVLDNNAAGTRGFVGLDHRNAQIVVAFRGSDNLQNWLGNMLVVQTPYDSLSSCGPECKVHTGFLADYLTLRKSTRSAVLELLNAYPTYSIVATGHSLGGAMATLAAADLQELLYRGGFNATPQPLTLYTFASPRVGNAAFAQWVTDLLSDGASYRITHARDPVVRLPFRSWDYAHLPHEVFYKNLLNSSRVMCVDTVTSQDKKCSAGQLSVVMPDHEHYMGESVDCDLEASNPQTQTPSLPWQIYLQLAREYAKSVF